MDKSPFRCHARFLPTCVNLFDCLLSTNETQWTTSGGNPTQLGAGEVLKAIEFPKFYASDSCKNCVAAMENRNVASIVLAVRAMKGALFLTGMFIAVQAMGQQSTAVRSESDMDSLLSRASGYNRAALLLVTSTAADCADCQQMQRTFLSDQTFLAWVQRSAEFGILDVSQGSTPVQDGRRTMSAMSPEIGDILRQLHVESLPELVLLHGNGRILGSVTLNDTPTNAVAKFQKLFESESRPAAPAIATATTNHLKAGITLKMISGTAQRRLATINEETFLVGEKHMITVGTNKLAIQCLVIEEHSVVVQIDGEKSPRELKLGETIADPTVKPKKLIYRRHV
jgi:thioredoxin-related protein